MFNPDEGLTGAPAFLALILVPAPGQLESLDLAGVLQIHDGDEGLFHQPPVQSGAPHAAPGGQPGQHGGRQPEGRVVEQSGDLPGGNLQQKLDQQEGQPEGLERQP
jgi:hypothetical protein